MPEHWEPSDVRQTCQSADGGQEGPPHQFACPTCGATQTMSDVCRRCRSDLRDLRGAWRASGQARAACLRALRTGAVDRALEHARRYSLLFPGPDAARLLGVCSLLREDWDAALRSACQG